MSQSLRDQINELVEDALAEATRHKPPELGLDMRSACRIYRGEDFLAVTLRDDRSMQYYGGFEYVDKAYRMEAGEYVFYYTDDDRVYGHHSRVQDDEDEICSECNGSGEGQYDGTRCQHCGGQGTEPCSQE